MIPKETAYKIIEDLVMRFKEHIASYKKSDCNETQTRRNFIDYFFKSLCWEMENREGNAEEYREVVNKNKVKVGAANKAYDYPFNRNHAPASAAKANHHLTRSVTTVRTTFCLYR
jgi:anaerobic ribonucleoside-triphosphate reductase